MKWVIIGSGNSSSPVSCQAIIHAKAVLFSIGFLEMNWGEILNQNTKNYFRKMHLKIVFAKCLPFRSTYFIGCLLKLSASCSCAHCAAEGRMWCFMKMENSHDWSLGVMKHVAFVTSSMLAWLQFISCLKMSIIQTGLNKYWQFKNKISSCVFCDSNHLHDCGNFGGVPISLPDNNSLLV